MTLSWHEARNGGAVDGHTMKKHLSKSPEYLLDRTINERRPGTPLENWGLEVASAFTGQNAAARVIFPTIEANRSDVIQWLVETQERDYRLHYRGDPNDPIGYGYLQGDTDEHELWLAVVVLRRLPPNSFYIHTACPADQL
jgi:hypothetical protein